MRLFAPARALSFFQFNLPLLLLFPTGVSPARAEAGRLQLPKWVFLPLDRIGRHAECLVDHAIYCVVDCICVWRRGAVGRLGWRCFTAAGSRTGIGAGLGDHRGLAGWASGRANQRVGRENRIIVRVAVACTGHGAWLDDDFVLDRGAENMFIELAAMFAVIVCPVNLNGPGCWARTVRR